MGSGAAPRQRNGQQGGGWHRGKWRRGGWTAARRIALQWAALGRTAARRVAAVDQKNLKLLSHIFAAINISNSVITEGRCDDLGRDERRHASPSCRCRQAKRVASLGKDRD